MTTSVEKFKQLWNVLRNEENERYTKTTAGLKYGTPEYRMAIDAGRWLYDGEYDLTGFEYLVVRGEEGHISLGRNKKDETEKLADEALAFIEKHTNFTFGHGYQASSMVLVSGRPPRYDGKIYGFYGRGATCVFEKPAVLLLIAEDD